MDRPFRIDDLAAESLEQLLALAPSQRSEEENRAVDDFVVRIGGWNNAHEAVALLGQIENGFARW